MDSFTLDAELATEPQDASQDAISEHPPAALTSTPKQARTADTPKYRRLTNADRSLILALHRQKLTQVEIAQRIGCSQPSVSEWLTQCQDTTADASLYLRGQALPMARKVAKTDDPRALIAALKGVNVLADEQAQGVTVIVEGHGQVNIGLVSPPVPRVTGEGA